MLDVFRLIPAMQVVFTNEIEFVPDSFVNLTPEQLEAWVRREGEPTETLYRVVHFEPQAIERLSDKVTWELSIVTESERQLLLDAVNFVYRSSASMTNENPTFAQRLEHLRPRLPPIVTQKPD